MFQYSGSPPLRRSDSPAAKEAIIVATTTAKAVKVVITGAATNAATEITV